jgi:hypothetical protein
VAVVGNIGLDVTEACNVGEARQIDLAGRNVEIVDRVVAPIGCAKTNSLLALAPVSVSLPDSAKIGVPGA